jgi:O-antigen/teichoic acid export membrane protein
MNQLRRVINNTIISLFGQAVTWTSTFLLTVAYGRFLGDSKFGELYFTITFLTLLSIPLEIGNNNQIIRGVAQEPHKALPYFSSTIIIKLCTWPLVYAFALLLIWLLDYPLEVRVLVGIYGLVILSEAFTNTFASFHYAFQRTIFPSVGLILEKGLTALFGVLLLRRGVGVEVMALVMLGASLVSMVWQAVWFFRLIGIKFVIDQGLIRTIVRANVPFLFYGLLLMGYTNIDTVLLSFMTNSAVVGWYGAASRLFDIELLTNYRNWHYHVSHFRKAIC